MQCITIFGYCCKRQLQAEERSECGAGNAKLRSVCESSVGLWRRLLWQTGLCRYCLQCPSLLCGVRRHPFMDERDRVRALFGGDRVDALAQPAQLLHAQDCLLHLLRLDVLEFVDVESFSCTCCGPLVLSGRDIRLRRKRLDGRSSLTSASIRNVMMKGVRRVKSLSHWCKEHLQAEECRSVGQEAQS